MSQESRSSTAFAERALEFVSDNSVVGLGTGHAATDFIYALGRRVKTGLVVRGVPTSEASAELARQLHIPLVSLSEVDSIDVAVDGADEVTPALDLIKGFYGSLLREKIVAAAAKRLVIVVGGEKLVATLGTRGKLPVEVAPFGLSFCQQRIEGLGFKSHPRMHGADL
ncbi:MAG: ribose 5-phosphate isomerase A [Pyrinomonadaceae bacterium]